MTGRSKMTSVEDIFLHRLEHYNFRINRFEIIRLEAQTPLPRGYLERAQEALGDHTTQIGRFSWTKFRNWENALAYYMQNHQNQHHHNVITAQPVSVPGYTYEKLMDAYKDRAANLVTMDIPHVPRWPTPIDY